MVDKTTNSLLGLDRKAMEEERLQRLARKRKVEQAENAPGDAPFKKAKLQSSLPLATTSDAKNDKRIPIVPPNIAVSQAPATNSKINGNASVEYPFGTLKRTWAQGYPRNNDIKIEELLQKNTLKTAVFSSWQWDFDWLLPKIELKQTKCIFVMEAKSEAEKDSWRAQFEEFGKIARLCFPPMRNHAYSRMHSKLMLLFHPGYMRVVVPSANPTRHDWGESGLLENMVFVIDLPRLEKDSVKGHTTAFEREFQRFLEAMCLPEDMREGVRNFDFSKTADLRFVHSIPGSYNADDALQSGLAGLSEAVRSMRSKTTPDEQIEVDYAAASVGSLDNVQIAHLYASLYGLDPYKLTKAAKCGLDGKPPPNFRLIFPTESYVQGSRGGADAGGTIFLKQSAFEKSTFPRDILHKYVSTRPGLLSHNKLILLRTAKAAYLYTGSANLSQSAWGRLTVPKGSQMKPKLDISNWECGVLVPVARAGGIEAEGVVPHGVFKERLDVPFLCPPEKYEDGCRPWITK